VRLEDGSRPRLVSWARLRRDDVRGQTMLVYPEKGLALSETGAAIVALCREGHTVAEIVATLAARYGAPAATVDGDVRDFLESLRTRGLLELEGPAA